MTWLSRSARTSRGSCHDQRTTFATRRAEATSRTRRTRDPRSDWGSPPGISRRWPVAISRWRQPDASPVGFAHVRLVFDRLLHRPAGFLELTSLHPCVAAHHVQVRVAANCLVEPIDRFASLVV